LSMLSFYSSKKIKRLKFVQFDNISMTTFTNQFEVDMSILSRDSGLYWCLW